MPKIRKDLSLIPRGMYCYTVLGWSEDRYKKLMCPYLSKDGCTLVKTPIWGYMKECKINE